MRAQTSASSAGTDSSLRLALVQTVGRRDAWRGARMEFLGEENRHQEGDEGDAPAAVFHELDEALIGRLMLGIIVAVGGRVGHFAMVCHGCPQSVIGVRSGVELAQTEWRGNGMTRTFARLSAHSRGQLSRI